MKTRGGHAALIASASLAMAMAVAATANGEIVGFVGDTTLEGGWYAFEDMFDVEMTPIIHGGSVYDSVIGIEVPEFGGSLVFDSAHSLRQIGHGWGSWSHGYMGEVFYNNGFLFMGYDLDMVGVRAFDAYIQPNGGTHVFWVTAYGAGGGETTIETNEAHWYADATHFGFYSPDEDLIRIEIQGTGDWAIGEWRVGVPGPGVMAFFAVAGVCRGRIRCN